VFPTKTCGEGGVGGRWREKLSWLAIARSCEENDASFGVTSQVVTQQPTYNCKGCIFPGKLKGWPVIIILRKAHAQLESLTDATE